MQVETYTHDGVYCGNNVMLHEQRKLINVNDDAETELSHHMLLTDGVQEIDVSYVPYNVLERVLEI